MTGHSSSSGLPGGAALLTRDCLKVSHFHAQPREESLRCLKTDGSKGLAGSEAIARKATFGANVMTPARKHGLLRKLYDQVANILMIILLAAAIVAGIMRDWVELGFIVGVIIINVVIGIVQESKSEKAAEALKKLLSAEAIVIRDGTRSSIDASELVPGDIVFIEAGSRVPADGRLMQATNLAIMEAALTGESVPAEKDAAVTLPADAPLGDRHNMVFAGSLVTAGQATFAVTATGDYNEIGKINRMVQTSEAGKTPLLLQIETFGRWLSVAVIGVAVITLLVAHFADHVHIGESFKIAVAVAVAIIPEGLPSVVTVILALGVQAMAKKNAIIRQLPAVETLGCVSVICSDKTGTLTRNEMTAVQLRTCLEGDMSQLRFTGQGFAPNGDVKRGDASLSGSEKLKVMFALLPAVLCNDSALECVSPAAPSKPADAVAVAVTVPPPAKPLTLEPGAAGEAAATSDAPTSPTALSSAAVMLEMGQVRNTQDSVGENTGTGTSRLTRSSRSGRDVLDLLEAADGPGLFVGTAFADGAEWKLTGDPTEGALLVAAMKAGWVQPAEAQRRFARLSTIPFDSDLKLMATLHDVRIPRSMLPGDDAAAHSQDPSTARPGGAGTDATTQPAAEPSNATTSTPNTTTLTATTTASPASAAGLVTRRLLLVKGAPDRLIARCAYQSVASSPFHTEPIDAAAWQSRADLLSSEGLRVLALAMCEMPDTTTSITTADVVQGEPKLTLTALVGIVDPPREECITAIRECHKAGVRVAMITGDSPLTAQAIGSWLGIPTSEVLTGPQMQAMTDDALADRVAGCNIFARATPEHKQRIVHALQTRYKAVVAMTGDGVNDAPALKAANVGVAMGITGTEVAKEASRMVLADDNFATIVAAIKEGRRVFDNLVKVLAFVLPTNVAQGICILAAIVIGMPFPLSAIQILYINMITSVTLGMVLAMEPCEEGIMSRAPRRAGKAIVGKFTLWRCFFVGTLLIVAMLGNMQWELVRYGYQTGGDDEAIVGQGRAVAMATLTVGQALYVFNCRFLKTTSLKANILLENPSATLMALLNVGLQCLLIYAPGIQDIFGLAPIDGIAWVRCIGFTFAIFLLVELEKAIGPRYIRPLFAPCLRRVHATMYPRVNGANVATIAAQTAASSPVTATSAPTASVGTAHAV